MKGQLYSTVGAFNKKKNEWRRFNEWISFSWIIWKHAKELNLSPRNLIQSIVKKKGLCLWDWYLCTAQFHDKYSLSDSTPGHRIDSLRFISFQPDFQVWSPRLVNIWCHIVRRCCTITIVENARQSHTWQWASGHVRSRSEECMWRVLGGWRKLIKITRFSFPLLRNIKKYFTNPSCLPHWQRKTSSRSTALVSRIGLQPFLRTCWYPALVPCSATAVEADFGVRPKVRQYTSRVLKRTESLIVPKTSHTQALGSADAAEK